MMSEMGNRDDGGEMLTDEDLLTEVLSRLPVKYILGCKAVSKPLYSLISSPNFIKYRHQSNSAKDNKVATLVVQLPQDDNYFGINDGSCSLFQLGAGSDDFLAHLKFPLPSSRLIGCDSGIVCVCFYLYFKGNISVDIYLWNPATKQSKCIPPPNNLLRTRHGCAGSIKETLGFGIDPIDSDFKVVRVVFPNIFSDNVRPVYFPEVYSAKRDAWRDIESKLTDFPKVNMFHVCLHGFLFSTGDDGMMAFNLNKEVFVCNIELTVSSNETQVAEFKDSISVIICKCEELGDKINLWTLDDEACLHGGGAKASWTFKLSIDVGVRFDCVQGFFNNVEFLLGADGWFSYNSDNKVGRYIMPDPLFSFDGVFKYRESLLSVAGSKLVQWSDDEDVNEGHSFDSEDDYEGNSFDSEEDNEGDSFDSEDDSEENSEDNEKSNINEEGCIDSEDDNE